jgi:hypothetical protein
MYLNNIHKKVLANIIIDCIDNGITLLLSNTKKVKLPEETIGTGGYFDESDRILAVATKNPTKIWFALLLHEYNHLRQWAEGMFNNPKYFSIDLWNWIEGNIELTKKDIDKAIECARLIETDCEKRTAKMIKDNPDLKIDLVNYIKGANSYLYFYEIVRKHRLWCKKAPYRIKEIIDLMPDYFVNNYKKLPKGYEKLVLEKCF